MLALLHRRRRLQEVESRDTKKGETRHKQANARQPEREREIANRSIHGTTHHSRRPERQPIPQFMAQHITHRTHPPLDGGWDCWQVGEQGQGQLLPRTRNPSLFQFQQPWVEEQQLPFCQWVAEAFYVNERIRVTKRTERGEPLIRFEEMIRRLTLALTLLLHKLCEERGANQKPIPPSIVSHKSRS